MKSVGIGIAAGFVITLLIVLTYWHSFYEQRFYPGVWVNDVNVSGLTPTEAKQQLASRLQSQPLPADTWIIQITAANTHIASSAADLGLQPDIDAALTSAWNLGHTGSLPERARTIWQLHRSPQRISIPPRFDRDKVSQYVDQLNTKIFIEHSPPRAILGTSNTPTSLRIESGKMGREISREQTIQHVLDKATYADITLDAFVASTGAQLNAEQVEAARARASTLIGKKAEFKYQTTRVLVHDQELIGLLAFPTGISDSSVNKLLNSWEKLVDRPSQEPIFEYDPNTLKVKTFVPPRDGLKLDREKMAQELTTVITNWEHQTTTDTLISKELAVAVAKSQRSLGETNNLGITELIGFGESEYEHSIPSRIHNVALTTSRINLTIVKPGEEFSFNKSLGDVSSATGFKPAYVIKGGMTVLGDGGGVCQVSSTLFRALLNGGLKITRRLPHSYRVTYYELNSDPGFDATVYSGNVDLRFVNDTGHHLLIHGEADSKRLYMKMEIYGTSDGRTAEILDYKKWDFRAPPPAQYFPDPSLPPGKTKQIDWSASGLKASFRYLVKDKDGNVKQDTTYTSNYQPWAAKYLQGI